MKDKPSRIFIAPSTIKNVKNFVDAKGNQIMVISRSQYNHAIEAARNVLIQKRNTKDITPVKPKLSVKLETTILRWLAKKLGILKEYDELMRKLP